MAKDTRPTEMSSLNAALETSLSDTLPITAMGAKDAPFGDAFRAFYERNFRFVFRILSRLADRAGDVDDLTQEVFTIAGAKLPEFEGRAKETTWLYRIACNVANADRRKRRRQHLLSMKWLKPSADEETVEGPDRDVERNDAKTLVHEVLAGIGEKKRTVFILFELEGVPGNEVAEMVGCPLDTMWTRLFHARREFRAALAARGLRSSADLERIPGLAASNDEEDRDGADE